MSAETPRPSFISDGNLVTPPESVEVMRQVNLFAHHININAGAHFARHPNGYSHFLSCVNFTDSLRSEIGGAIQDGRWSRLKIDLPFDDDEAHRIIARYLVDPEVSPTVVEAQRLGSDIESLSYQPTLIPTLLIQEFTRRTADGQIYTERSLISQDLI